MYCSFFGLRTPPFGTSPDPRFLFVAPRIREILACLKYGITGRKGFVVMSGEVGTGKTTLLKSVLTSLTGNGISTAFVFNPRLDVLDFLEFVLHDFGIQPVSRSKGAMLIQFNKWLIERYRNNGLCVIVVDEAHDLTWELLEEIRLLTNLETSSEKLVQIVLAGQPELEDKLRDPSLRQLRQRVWMWCKTRPLQPDETVAYITGRLSTAGAVRPIFTNEAMQFVHSASNGIPRLINLVCEHALISAYAEQIQLVPLRTVELLFRELFVEHAPFVVSPLDYMNSDEDSEGLAQLITPPAELPPHNGREMSHIYEALERAELDRKNAASSEIPMPAFHATVPFEVASVAVSEPEVLPNVAEHAWEPSSPFVPTIEDHNSAIEQFRSLRSNIYQLRDQGKLKIIVVSSGMQGEGKTFVSINLALSLARNNEAGVLLIDGDLRNPTIHRKLGTSGTPGLREYLARGASLSDILQRNRPSDTPDNHGARALSHLAFIPGGQGSAETPELAGNLRLEELMAAVVPHFAWIIIDTPPVLMVSDAVDFSRTADGVLLVARGGVTPYEMARRAKASFANSRILGVVLNAVRNIPDSTYGYYGADK
jgi:general secretion pathway protein A